LDSRNQSVRNVRGPKCQGGIRSVPVLQHARLTPSPSFLEYRRNSLTMAPTKIRLQLRSWLRDSASATSSSHSHKRDKNGQGRIGKTRRIDASASSHGARARNARCDPEASDPRRPCRSVLARSYRAWGMRAEVALALSRSHDRSCSLIFVGAIVKLFRRYSRKDGDGVSRACCSTGTDLIPP